MDERQFARGNRRAIPSSIRPQSQDKMRTDSGSLTFFRQRIAQLSSLWTDSGSLRLVSVLTAPGDRPAVPRCFGQRLFGRLNRQGRRREPPNFPGHSWSVRAESAAAKRPRGAPQMTKAACSTDRYSAESGGSHGRSSERCVVGSPYFLAERSAVGSHLPYKAVGSGPQRVSPVPVR